MRKLDTSGTLDVFLHLSRSCIEFEGKKVEEEAVAYNTPDTFAAENDKSDSKVSKNIPITPLASQPCKKKHLPQAVSFAKIASRKPVVKLKRLTIPQLRRWLRPDELSRFLRRCERHDIKSKKKSEQNSGVKKYRRILSIDEVAKKYRRILSDDKVASKIKQQLSGEDNRNVTKQCHLPQDSSSATVSVPTDKAALHGVIALFENFSVPKATASSSVKKETTAGVSLSSDRDKNYQLSDKAKSLCHKIDKLAKEKLSNKGGGKVRLVKNNENESGAVHSNSENCNLPPFEQKTEKPTVTTKSSLMTNAVRKSEQSNKLQEKHASPIRLPLKNNSELPVNTEVFNTKHKIKAHGKDITNTKVKFNCDNLKQREELGSTAERIVSKNTSKENFTISSEKGAHNTDRLPIYSCDSKHLDHILTVRESSEKLLKTVQRSKDYNKNVLPLYTSEGKLHRKEIAEQRSSVSSGERALHHTSNEDRPRKLSFSNHIDGTAEVHTYNIAGINLNISENKTSASASVERRPSWCSEDGRLSESNRAKSSPASEKRSVSTTANAKQLTTIGEKSSAVHGEATSDGKRPSVCTDGKRPSTDSEKTPISTTSRRPSLTCGEKLLSPSVSHKKPLTAVSIKKPLTVNSEQKPCAYIDQKKSSTNPEKKKHCAQAGNKPSAASNVDKKPSHVNSVDKKASSACSVEKKPASNSSGENNLLLAGSSEKYLLPAGNCEKNPLPARNCENNPLPAGNCERNPLPAGNCEKNPLPAENSEKNPFLVGSDEKKPFPASHREKKPSPASHREKKPSPASHREKKPSPASHREKKPSPASHREKKPSPASHGEKKPSPAGNGEKKPSPAGSGEKKPSPVTSIDEQKPSPVTSIDEQKPSPVTSIDEQKPSPVTSIDEKKPSPVTSIDEKKPSPVTSIDEKKPSPVTSIDEKKPSPVTSIDEKKPAHTASIGEKRAYPTPNKGEISCASNSKSGNEKKPSTSGGGRRLVTCHTNKSTTSCEKNSSTLLEEKSPTICTEKKQLINTDERRLPISVGESKPSFNKDEKPSTSSGERKPSSSSDEKQPSGNPVERKPSASIREREPSVSIGERRPSANSGELRPSASIGDRRPSASGGDRRPSVSNEEKKPSASDGERRPSASDGERRPSASDGERRPSASDGERRPSASDGERRPSASGGERRPSASGGERRPSASGGERRPSASGGERRPSASGGERRPSASGGERRPSASGGERRPSASGGERRPSASGGERRPSASGGDRRPSASGGDRRPSASGGDRRPSASGGDRRPSASGGDRRPSVSNEEKKPSASSEERRPSASSEERRPSASSEERRPSASGGDRRPSVSNEEKKPSASGGERRPSAGICERRPSAGICERRPSAGICERRPSAGVCERRPSAGVCERRTSAGVGDRRTSAGVGDRRTSAGVGDRRTSAGVGDRRTSAGVGDRRTSAGVGDRRMSTGSGDRKPSASIAEKRSHISCTDGQPSTGIGEGPSSSNSKEKQSTSDSNERRPPQSISEKKTSADCREQKLLGKPGEIPLTFVNPVLVSKKTRAATMDLDFSLLAKDFSVLTPLLKGFETKSLTLERDAVPKTRHTSGKENDTDVAKKSVPAATKESNKSAKSQDHRIEESVETLKVKKTAQNSYNEPLLSSQANETASVKPLQLGLQPEKSNTNTIESTFLPPYQEIEQNSDVLKSPPRKTVPALKSPSHVTDQHRSPLKSPRHSEDGLQASLHAGSSPQLPQNATNLENLQLRVHSHCHPENELLSPSKASRTTEDSVASFSCDDCKVPSVLKFPHDSKTTPGFRSPCHAADQIRSPLKSPESCEAGHQPTFKSPLRDESKGQNDVKSNDPDNRSTKSRYSGTMQSPSNSSRHTQDTVTATCRDDPKVPSSLKSPSHSEMVPDSKCQNAGDKHRSPLKSPRHCNDGHQSPSKLPFNVDDRARISVKSDGVQCRMVTVQHSGIKLQQPSQSSGHEDASRSSCDSSRKVLSPLKSPCNESLTLCLQDVGKLSVKQNVKTSYNNRNETDKQKLPSDAECALEANTLKTLKSQQRSDEQASLEKDDQEEVFETVNVSEDSVRSCNNDGGITQQSHTKKIRLSNDNISCQNARLQTNNSNIHEITDQTKDILCEDSEVLTVTTSCGMIEKNVADQVASLEKDVADQVASLEKDVADQVVSLEKDVADQVVSLERNVAGQVTSLDKSVMISETTTPNLDEGVSEAPKHSPADRRMSCSSTGERTDTVSYTTRDSLLSAGATSDDDQVGLMERVTYTDVEGVSSDSLDMGTTNVYGVPEDTILDTEDNDLGLMIADVRGQAADMFESFDCPDPDAGICLPESMTICDFRSESIEAQNSNPVASNMDTELTQQPMLSPNQSHLLIENNVVSIVKEEFPSPGPSPSKYNNKILEPLYQLLDEVERETEDITVDSDDHKVVIAGNTLESKESLSKRKNELQFLPDSSDDSSVDGELVIDTQTSDHDTELSQDKIQGAKTSSMPNITQLCVNIQTPAKSTAEKAHKKAPLEWKLQKITNLQERRGNDPRRPILARRLSATKGTSTAEVFCHVGGHDNSATLSDQCIDPRLNHPLRRPSSESQKQLAQKRPCDVGSEPSIAKKAKLGAGLDMPSFSGANTVKPHTPSSIRGESDKSTRAIQNNTKCKKVEGPKRSSVEGHRTAAGVTQQTITVSEYRAAIVANSNRCDVGVSGNAKHALATKGTTTANLPLVSPPASVCPLSSQPSQSQKIQRLKNQLQEWKQRDERQQPSPSSAESTSAPNQGEDLVQTALDAAFLDASTSESERVTDDEEHGQSKTKSRKKGYRKKTDTAQKLKTMMAVQDIADRARESRLAQELPGYNWLEAKIMSGDMTSKPPTPRKVVSVERKSATPPASTQIPSVASGSQRSLASRPDHQSSPSTTSVLLRRVLPKPTSLSPAGNEEARNQTISGPVAAVSYPNMVVSTGHQVSSSPGSQISSSPLLTSAAIPTSAPASNKIVQGAKKLLEQGQQSQIAVASGFQQQQPPQTIAISSGTTRGSIQAAVAYAPLTIPVSDAFLVPTLTLQQPSSSQVVIAPLSTFATISSPLISISPFSQISPPTQADTARQLPTILTYSRPVQQLHQSPLAGSMLSVQVQPTTTVTTVATVNTNTVTLVSGLSNIRPKPSPVVGESTCNKDLITTRIKVSQPICNESNTSADSAASVGRSPVELPSLSRTALSVGSSTSQVLDSSVKGNDQLTVTVKSGETLIPVSSVHSPILVNAEQFGSFISNSVSETATAASTSQAQSHSVNEFSSTGQVVAGETTIEPAQSTWSRVEAPLSNASNARPNLETDIAHLSESSVVMLARSSSQIDSSFSSSSVPSVVSANPQYCAAPSTQTQIQKHSVGVRRSLTPEEIKRLNDQTASQSNNFVGRKAAVSHAPAIDAQSQHSVQGNTSEGCSATDLQSTDSRNRLNPNTVIHTNNASNVSQRLPTTQSYESNYPSAENIVMHPSQNSGSSSVQGSTSVRQPNTVQQNFSQPNIRTKERISSGAIPTYEPSEHTAAASNSIQSAALTSEMRPRAIVQPTPSIPSLTISRSQSLTEFDDKNPQQLDKEMESRKSELLELEQLAQAIEKDREKVLDMIRETHGELKKIEQSMQQPTVSVASAHASGLALSEPPPYPSGSLLVNSRKRPSNAVACDIPEKRTAASASDQSSQPVYIRPTPNGFTRSEGPPPYQPGVQQPTVSSLPLLSTSSSAVGGEVRQDIRLSTQAQEEKEAQELEIWLQQQTPDAQAWLHQARLQTQAKLQAERCMVESQAQTAAQTQMQPQTQRQQSEASSLQSMPVVRRPEVYGTVGHPAASERTPATAESASCSTCRAVTGSNKCWMHAASNASSAASAVGGQNSSQIRSSQAVTVRQQTTTLTYSTNEVVENRLDASSHLSQLANVVASAGPSPSGNQYGRAATVTQQPRAGSAQQHSALQPPPNRTVHNIPNAQANEERHRAWVLERQKQLLQQKELQNRQRHEQLQRQQYQEQLKRQEQMHRQQLQLQHQQSVAPHHQQMLHSQTSSHHPQQNLMPQSSVQNQMHHYNQQQQSLQHPQIHQQQQIQQQQQQQQQQIQQQQQQQQQQKRLQQIQQHAQQQAQQQIQQHTHQQIQQHAHQQIQQHAQQQIQQRNPHQQLQQHPQLRHQQQFRSEVGAAQLLAPVPVRHQLPGAQLAQGSYETVHTAASNRIPHVPIPTYPTLPAQNPGTQQQQQHDNIPQSSSATSSSSRVVKPVATAAVAPPPREPSPELRCRHCRQKASFMCSECQQAWYCKLACQIADWPQHSQICHISRQNSNSTTQ